jgi:hypothetical protein
MHEVERVIGLAFFPRARLAHAGRVGPEPELCEEVFPRVEPCQDQKFREACVNRAVGRQTPPQGSLPFHVRVFAIRRAGRVRPS